jgi:serine/threonine-protein kinase
MEGKRIGNWVIENRIGEGGMGEVWKAHHDLLKRHYAIKVMARQLLPDPNFEARFIKEASAQARLQHPHIVGVSDFFLNEGVYYLVMPYIEGQSLEERMKANDGPLPLAEALKIAQDVLHALDYAHQQAVIHRDVKPSNILLDRSGHAYLVDFGIALMIGQERRTRTGTSVGTPHYMSPEQILKPRELDHRADVYSFGCVLYEMLTGQPPFDASGAEGDTDYIIKGKHIESRPEPLKKANPKTDASEEIESIVMRALAKNPNERFTGCGEFARALLLAEKGLVSLIICPYCSSQNRLTKTDKLGQAVCGKCNKPLISIEPITEKTVDPFRKPQSDPPRSSGKGWKMATAGLGLSSLVAVIGWAITSSELSKVKSGSSIYSWDLNREKTRAQELETKNSQLQTELNNEKSFRNSLAEKTPLIITDIKLRHEDRKKNPLGDFTDRFNGSNTQYISWYANIHNISAGIKPLSGKLRVKYFNPDGSLRRGEISPPGFTMEENVNILDSKQVTSGWGNDNGTAYNVPGTYRIEFWWENKKVGETSFLSYR